MTKNVSVYFYLEKKQIRVYGFSKRLQIWQGLNHAEMVTVHWNYVCERTTDTKRAR